MLVNGAQLRTIRPLFGGATMNLTPLKHVSNRRRISTRELDNAKGDRERVVILGSGWSGFVLSRQLNKNKFQTVVVSPRSYFNFTPLLASTAVGTLEFRTTLESVRKRASGIEYFQGWADDVNFDKKTLTIEENAVQRPRSKETPKSLGDPQAEAKLRNKGQVFDLNYDKLVVAVGCYSQTFGTKGVRENAFFLKDIVDARKIRKRILECFEIASLPTTSEKMRKHLLNFAIVGGGPTGVEFAAELFDLCHEDLRKIYPSLIPIIKITIYDVAPKILPMFDSKLANYAMNLFKRDGIAIKTEHHIQELRPGSPEQETGEDANCFTLRTQEDGEIGIGMCVWSTGLMMNPFIQSALDTVHTYPMASAQPKSPVPSPASENWILQRSKRTGGLMVDSKFRVQLSTRPTDEASQNAKEAIVTDVFAIGDVAVLPEGLPATAQVANQQAIWLGKNLNQDSIEQNSFTYRNLGVMTYLGSWKAIMQTGGKGEIKGRTAWLVWRGAYLTQTMSYRNKLLIPIYWAINWFFGRDISRF